MVYYVFAFLKGIMLFTVILLIGSGWSLMKSYLNDQEKRIIWIVLTLQVLDNIAMIVLEESAPGSQGWLTWRDILHLVDIVCCCAILLPIVWSIRHLRYDTFIGCFMVIERRLCCSTLLALHSIGVFPHQLSWIIYLFF